MAKKLFNILKFVFINIVVFAVLLIVVNWACGVYLAKTSRKNRADLPNYAHNYEQAKQIFAEYHRVQHEYEPFVGWKTLPFNGETTHITREGLRTHTPGDTTTGGRPVVRFFGGSTMWGEGADDQHTIPALFNAILPEYKVYNHGQLAYNTRQELDELISVYARNEKTDIVIFYDGVNDAAFLCPKVIRELPAHRLVPMYREKLYTGTKDMLVELAKEIFIEDILALIHRATYRPTPGNSPYDCISEPGKAETIADMMMKNWEMAHELVTARNGQFLAVLQPAAFIGNPRTDHLELDPELAKNFREVYRLLREKIAEKDHPWILDLSEAFNGDAYILIDFCHVSANGNQIIAREIAEEVARMREEGS